MPGDKPRRIWLNDGVGHETGPSDACREAKGLSDGRERNQERRFRENLDRGRRMASMVDENLALETELLRLGSPLTGVLSRGLDQLMAKHEGGNAS